MTSSQATPVIACNVAGMPPIMRQYDHWVVWRLEPNEENPDKPKKMPYDPKQANRDKKTGEYRKAKAGVPSTWGTFEEAVAAYQGGNFSGIGFEFHPDDPFIGGDMDDCRNPETGELTDEAQWILSLANTYSEPSQSGRGVKFVGVGKKVSNERCKDDKKGVEMYDRARFFALTGCPLPTFPQTIEEREAEFASLYHYWFPVKEKPQPARPDAQMPADLSDAQILEMGFASKIGAKIQALWNGDTTGHSNNASKADAALCGYLAFYAGPGREDTVDRLFRQSGLYRNKWDEKHRSDGSTYGEMTLQFVYAGRTEYYQKSDRVELPPPTKSVSAPTSSTKQDAVINEQEEDMPPQRQQRVPAWQFKKWFRNGWRYKQDCEIAGRLVLSHVYNVEVSDWTAEQKNEWITRTFFKQSYDFSLRTIQNWASTAAHFPELIDRALQKQDLWQDGYKPKSWDFLRCLGPKGEAVKQKYMRSDINDAMTLRQELRESEPEKPIAHEPKGFKAMEKAGFISSWATRMAHEAQKHGAKEVMNRVDTVFGNRPAIKIAPDEEDPEMLDPEKERLRQENVRMRIQIEALQHDIALLKQENADLKAAANSHSPHIDTVIPPCDEPASAVTAPVTESPVLRLIDADDEEWFTPAESPSDFHRPGEKNSDFQSQNQQKPIQKTDDFEPPETQDNVPIDRLKIARKIWPDLTAAVESGTVPPVPWKMRYENGLPYQVSNLQFTAGYNLKDFLSEDREAQEAAAARLPLLQAAYLTATQQVVGGST